MSPADGGSPGPGLIRAFVAVELPDSIRDETLGLISRLRRRYPEVRWVGPTGLHLTLAFLGENPPEFIELTRAALSRIPGRRRGFELSLNRLGCFPDQRAPRVVWVGVDSGRGELIRLAEEIRQALVSTGFVPERRPFSPHLTLGRVRQPLGEIDRLLGTEFRTLPFAVDGFTLFRSTLLPDGPRYDRLAEYRFGP